MATDFAPGTPPDVRELIDQYLAVPELPADLRAGIRRLAGNESMEPLWTQLHRGLQGKEADIILFAIEAYYEALSLQPPRKVQQKKIDDFLRAHHSPITDPALRAEYDAMVRKASHPLTYGMIAFIARWLGETLDEIWGSGRQRWAEVWPGDPALSFDKIRSIVEGIAACCDRLDLEAQEMAATKHLPNPPRKKGGHSAQRVHFDRILKDRFQENFGRRYPGIVATLEQVAFDLPEAVDESTVLKR
jgi:hypothetical protein